MKRPVAPLAGLEPMQPLREMQRLWYAARYAHLADDIRRTMADDVGEVVREAMDSDPNIQLLDAPGTGRRRA